MLRILFFSIFILFTSLPISNCLALRPENHLLQPEEERAHNLFLQVRCPTCSGQVIESSDSEIAYQLRKLIREKIADGLNDEQIKFYLINEFGADIITSPALNSSNLLLWLLPIIFFIIGAIIIIFKLLSPISSINNIQHHQFRYQTKRGYR